MARTCGREEEGTRRKRRMRLSASKRRPSCAPNKAIFKPYPFMHRCPELKRLPKSPRFTSVVVSGQLLNSPPPLTAVLAAVSWSKSRFACETHRPRKATMQDAEILVSFSRPSSDIPTKIRFPGFCELCLENQRFPVRGA